MSIDFTRPSLFRGILYFLLLYLLFRCRGYFLLEPAAHAEDLMMPLQKWLTAFFTGHPLLREITLFLLTLSTSLSITQILSQNLIYLERTYVPAMIFPLFALGYTSSAITPTSLIVAFLLVYAIKNMIKSHKLEENSSYFLNAAVALGLAPLFYAPSIVFFLLLLVGFTLFQQNWRSVFISLTGYLLPIFFCSYILWGMGEDFGGTGRKIASILFTPQSEAFFAFRMEPWGYFLAVLFLALSVIAIVSFYSGQTQTRRRALRGYTIFIWTLVFSMGMIAFPCRNLDLLPILAVPLAAVIPACFNRRSGWYPNLLYLLMLWSIIFYNIYLLFPFFTA